MVFDGCIVRLDEIVLIVNMRDQLIALRCECVRIELGSRDRPVVRALIIRKVVSRLVFFFGGNG